MSFEDVMTGCVPLVEEPQQLAASIVETVREPLIVLDAELRVRLANRSFYRTFHVNRAETEGVQFFRLGSCQWEIPELRTLLLDILPRNTQVQDFEIEREFPGLGRRIMLLNARRLEDRARASGMILLAIEDITERRRTEEERRLLSAIVEFSEDAILSKTLDGIITSWNSGAEKMYGYASAEAVGQHVSLIIPQERRDEVETFRQKLQCGERIRNLETVRVGKDGRPVNVSISISPIRDWSGRIIGDSTIARDISVRKRAEEELRKSEERFKLVARATNDAVYDRNLLTDEVWWNASFLELFGCGAEDGEHTLESSWMSRIHPDDRERIVREIQDLIEGGRDTWSGEYRFRRADGSYAIVFDRAYVWHTDEGQAVRLLGSVMDITERKRIEQQLKIFASRLERSNRELQDFASVASHDLQEPLRKIQAFGDRLKDKCSDSLGEEGRDYLHRMQSAAKRMQTLINDLLMFSRVETKAQPFVPVDLSLIALEVASDLEVQVEQTGARLEIGELPVIEADPVQMRQLFQNLIGNSLKYRRPDCAPVINVRAVVVKDRRLNVRPGTLPLGQICQLYVEDNGIGFDEKYLDRIFTVFQRLHGRKEYEGTGVGLAVCRKIAERHGGNITAHSTPGSGATFVVTLPAQQTTEAEAE